MALERHKQRHSIPKKQRHSFFAAEAGAKKGYAVEIEHVLAQQLRKSIELNNLSNVVEVIEGDILKVDLPKGVLGANPTKQARTD